MKTIRTLLLLLICTAALYCCVDDTLEPGHVRGKRANRGCLTYKVSETLYVNCDGDTVIVK